MEHGGSGMAAAGLAIWAAAAQAGEGEALRNWFDDPFFQAAGGLPGCPAPLGPLLARSQMPAEAHYRAERGTSCWLEGKCAQPNAYLYDAPIGQAIQQRLRQTDAFAGASIWVTVKRRFVWVEGCVPDAAMAASLETFMRAVPDVERVIVDVMAGVKGRPPYPVSKP